MRQFTSLLVLLITLSMGTDAVWGQQAPKPVVGTAPAKSLEVRFQELDTNGDGALSRDELLAKVAQEKRKERARDFQLLDFDADGRLSLDEYRNVPGVAPRDERGPVPDPIVDWMEQQLAKLNELLNRADDNSDGTWARQEWPEAKIADLFPSGSLVSFANWDRNHDGHVDSPELRFRLEVLFGIRHETGALLRRPTGEVFFLRGFTDRDRDGDRILTAQEFMAFKSGTPEKLQQTLKQVDANQDGRMSLAELTGGPQMFWRNVLSDFLRFDSDFNGRVSSQELKMHAPRWDQKIVDQIFPAFDTDGDGQLTFVEYRSCPSGNPLQNWRPKDTDGDGTITVNEYHSSSMAAYVALSALFFARLDQDHDGHLSLDEVAFNVDVKKAPLEIVFRVRDTDHDGRWSLEEAAGAAPKASVNDAEAVKKREERLMRIEDAFRMADADADNHLTLKELQESEDAVSVLFPGRGGRGRSRSRGARVGGTDETSESWNWRLIGLVSFNILLWAGLAWLVLRPRKLSR